MQTVNFIKLLYNRYNIPKLQVHKGSGNYEILGGGGLLYSLLGISVDLLSEEYSVLLIMSEQTNGLSSILCCTNKKSPVSFLVAIWQKSQCSTLLSGESSWVYPWKETTLLRNKQNRKKA